MRKNVRQIVFWAGLLSLFVSGTTGCTFGGQSQSATSVPTLPATATSVPTTIIVPTTAIPAAATVVPKSAVPKATVPKTAAPTTTPIATKPTLAPVAVNPTAAPTKPPPTATPTNPPTVPPPTVAPTTVPPTAPPTVPPTIPPTQPNTATLPGTASSNVSGAASSVPSGTGPRILAWDRDAKQVAWYVTSGAPQAVATGSASRATNCGQTADGNGLILYYGDAVAQPNLVPLNAATPPVSLGDSSALACDLSGRTAFSPDGKHLALIKYTADAATNADFTTGTLRILSMPGATEQTTFDNVTAFDLENDGALMVKFYPNAKKQADRADLTWWDASASKERPLETNIKSLDGCTFSSARSVRAGDKVYTAIGEHCTNPIVSVYRVLRTDFAGGNTVNFIDKTPVSGKYFSNTNTNDLELLPGGQALLLAVPNGFQSNLANLILISLPDGKQMPVLSSVVTDQSVSMPLPRRFLFNPLRTQLALVQHNVNGGETLYMYDLTNPAQAPAQVTDVNRSDQVIGLAWNQAGNRLAYVLTGDDAALGYIDLGGTSKLVARGTFQGLALSPDGQTAATAETNKVGAADTRYNLVTIALSDGAKTVIVTGNKGASALNPLAMR